MDHVVYYQMSDGEVIGSSSTPGRVDIARELPPWGPGIAALRVDEYPVRIGQLRRVVNGRLQFRPDPEVEAWRALRRSAMNRLRGLGFTPQEARVLFGDDP